MIVQPIRIEGFIPIFALIINNPKFIVEQPKRRNQLTKKEDEQSS